MSDAMEEAAFEFMAHAHPCETYDTWPERFWRYFQQRCPGVSREEMERLLAATWTEIERTLRGEKR